MVVESVSRQNEVRAQAFSVLCSRVASDGDHTWASFRHCLKAMRVVDAVSRRLRELGFTEAELGSVYPVMLHVEALVYQGDLAYEECQKQRSSSSSTVWSSGIEEVLDSYGLDDHGLREELEDLNRFFRDESLIMLRDSRVTEASVVETCYRRSSDIRLLIRLAYQLTHRPGCEDFIRLSRPFMALAEIWDDLDSYEKDIAEDNFNTLRLFGWVHGTDQARRRLQVWMGSLIQDCIDEMARAEKLALVVQYMLATRWRTRSSAIDEVEIKPKRNFIRLFRLLPRTLLFQLTTRQLKFIRDNLCTRIPQMIEEPSRLA